MCLLINSRIFLYNMEQYKTSIKIDGFAFMDHRYPEDYYRHLKSTNLQRLIPFLDDGMLIKIKHTIYTPVYKPKEILPMNELKLNELEYLQYLEWSSTPQYQIEYSEYCGFPTIDVLFGLKSKQYIIIEFIAEMIK